MTFLRVLSRRASRLAALPFLLAVVTRTGVAQDDALRNLRTASRTELEEAAVALDRLAASTAYSEQTRGRARAQAAGVRRRLTEGDFRPGDRVVIRLELPQGATADGTTPLTPDDTATVLEGKRLPVRGFRQVALEGVLRSEIETLVRTELTDFVRNARVTVRPLMRVAVFGSVGRQGYLTVPVETTLDDLLTLAGGLGPDANAKETNLQRADTVIYTADEVRTALSSGSTVGALGLEDGDALVVPRLETDRDYVNALRNFTFILSSISILLIRFR